MRSTAVRLVDIISHFDNVALVNANRVISAAPPRGQRALFLLRSSVGLSTVFGFCLMLTSTPGEAQLTSGDWQYSINGNNAIITRYIGSSSDVSIPSTINGLPVQYIDIAAFSGNITLTNVFIPSSVYAVLNGAGVVPFDSCINLASIVVDPSNLAFSSADGVLFNKKQTSLLEYPNGKGGSYAIPVGVLRVASYAFDGCTNLTSVTIPNTVTNIMNQAFHSCSGLTSITIPASVQAIGAFAFTGCDYLTNIFFAGNPPVAWDGPVFNPDWVILPKIMYYIPGTIGWGPTYAGFPTSPLKLTVNGPTVQGGQFSFSVAGPFSISIVVESCTSLDSATWSPIQIGNLSAGPWSISDPDWANYPARFYRIRLE